MRAILLSCIAFLAAASSVLAGAKTYSGRTIIYYDQSHGTQVEYYSPKGRAYLWYPGNRRAVPGLWQVQGENICFQYGPNTYNPVTRTRGGKWECKPMAPHKKWMTGSCRGDVFKLATGRIPYRLIRGRAALNAVSARCR